MSVPTHTHINLATCCCRRHRCCVVVVAAATAAAAAVCVGVAKDNILTVHDVVGPPTSDYHICWRKRGQILITVYFL